MNPREQTNQSWYIGATRDEVGEAAILVGDPARVGRLAEHMRDVTFLPERRGLTTITGTRGRPARHRDGLRHGRADRRDRAARTVCAGRRHVPADRHGDGRRARSARRFRRRRRRRAWRGRLADLRAARLSGGGRFRSRHAPARATGGAGHSWHAGIFGTYDGFYTEMFDLSGERRAVIDSLKHDIRRLGLIGTDMETAALLSAARILGARASTPVHRHRRCRNPGQDRGGADDQAASARCSRSRSTVSPPHNRKSRNGRKRHDRHRRPLFRQSDRTAEKGKRHARRGNRPRRRGSAPTASPPASSSSASAPATAPCLRWRCFRAPARSSASAPSSKAR